MKIFRKRVQLRKSGGSLLGSGALSQESDVQRTIIRGRITRDEALVEFELEGEWDAINRAILGLGEVGEVIRIWDPPVEAWAAQAAAH